MTIGTEDIYDDVVSFLGGGGHAVTFSWHEIITGITHKPHIKFPIMAHGHAKKARLGLIKVSYIIVYSCMSALCQAEGSS